MAVLDTRQPDIQIRRNQIWFMVTYKKPLKITCGTLKHQICNNDRKPKTDFGRLLKSFNILRKKSDCDQLNNRQNHGLRTADWHFTSQREADKGRTLAFSIKQDSFNGLKKKGIKVF